MNWPEAAVIISFIIAWAIAWCFFVWVLFTKKVTDD